MGYNYPYQTQYRQPTPYPSWNGSAPNPLVRPVSSLEEVKTSPIDFDGSVFYFSDMANRKIYTKQIGLDGTAIINLYEQKEITTPSTSIEMAGYVTKEEFQETIKQLIAKYESLVPKEKEIIEEKPATFSF